MAFTTISIREKNIMFVSSVLSFVVFGSSCFIYVILNYYIILSTRFEGTAYSSGASEFIPDILWGSCWSVFSVLWDVEYCLSCCPFSSGHCFVSPSFFFWSLFCPPLLFLLVIVLSVPLTCYGCVTPLVSVLIIIYSFLAYHMDSKEVIVSMAITEIFDFWDMRSKGDNEKKEIILIRNRTKRPVSYFV